MVQPSDAITDRRLPMMRMPQAIHTVPAVSVLDALVAHGADLLAGIRVRLVRQRTCAIVEGLTDAQAADAGIDRSAVLPPRPTIEVETGLMNRLMSMR